MHSRVIFSSLLLVVVTGCARLNGPPAPHDPFERYNRAMYTFNDSFDRAIAKPVAKVYRAAMPSWADKGVTNFFSNIDDIAVILNDLLQLKFRQCIADMGRFLVNSTLGLAGFIDIATALGLPKHYEDFGQTLGYWGVPPGPYLMLPFLGPNTIRDTTGLAVDLYEFDPTLNLVDHVAIRNRLLLTDLIDTRADLLQSSRLLETAALDPYTFLREAYLQRRQYLVYDGNPPQDDKLDPFADEP